MIEAILYFMGKPVKTLALGSDMPPKEIQWPAHSTLIPVNEVEPVFVIPDLYIFELVRREGPDSYSYIFKKIKPLYKTLRINTTENDIAKELPTNRKIDLSI